MNDRVDNPGDLSVSKLVEIDKICRQFEAAWKAGKCPRVEDFLSSTPEPQRSELRRELVSIDSEFRNPATNPPSLEQFLQQLNESDRRQAAEVQASVSVLPVEKTPEARHPSMAEPVSALAACTLPRDTSPAAVPLPLAEGSETVSFHEGPVATPEDSRVASIPEYEVLKKLGEGGMGTVHLVRHRGDGRLYAVKQTKILREEHRRRFLGELQIWINLPLHPNVAACRFFRTIDSSILIFSEYVAGGSLAQWIRDRHLYEAGDSAVLKRILDIAIQTAWGLHAVHRRNTVHQDVKPGNILMTPDGVAKIADFGLARACVQAGCGGTEAAPPNDRLLVSWNGMTPGYCSPEQERGQSLTSQTDIWSWGVCVLEMFAGGIRWRSGPLAPRVLDDLSAANHRTSAAAHRTADVVAVLRHCFEDNPHDRWQSLRDAADALIEIYKRLDATRNYPRAMPPEPQLKDAGQQDRSTRGGICWESPREWLEHALRLAGREPDEADSLVLARTGTRQSQALSDLAAFEDALLIYQRLVDEGSNELTYELATLCAEKALVHDELGDPSSAIQLLDRSRQLYERLLAAGGDQVRDDLARVQMNKATVYIGQGQHARAVELLRESISQYQRLVDAGVTSDKPGEIENSLAKAHLNLGTAFDALGRCKEAIEHYDRAIVIRQRLVDVGESRYLDDLALTCNNKSNTLKRIGNLRGALEFQDRAIGITQQLVRQGRPDLRLRLAMTCMNKGHVLYDLGQFPQAIDLYDRALAVHEQRIAVGHDERREELARTHMGKGNALARLGQFPAALEQHAHAVKVCERLVDEGHREAEFDLARAYNNQSKVLLQLNRFSDAAACIEVAIKIYERLLPHGRADIACDLAETYANKGGIAIQLGNARQAIAAFDRGIDLAEQLLAGGMSRMTGLLNMMQKNRNIAVGQSEGRP